MLQVVNRISGQIVEELQFEQTSEAVTRGVIGLCSDATAGLFYAYDQHSVFQVSLSQGFQSYPFFFFQCCTLLRFFHVVGCENVIQVSVNDEGRDMWKVYLDMKEYAAALANCRDPIQRDQVYLVQVMSNCSYCSLFLVIDLYHFKCSTTIRSHKMCIDNQSDM